MKNRIKMYVMVFLLVLSQVLPLQGLVASAAEVEPQTTQAEDNSQETVPTEVVEQSDNKVEENVEVAEEPVDNSSEEEATTEVETTSLEKSTDSVNESSTKPELQSVQNAPRTLDAQTFYGIALQDPTNIYPTTSTSEAAIKSYPVGSKLKYESYNAEFHQATVYINGVPTTGYIKVSDVENITTNQVDLQGIGLSSPTAVYSKAATNSSILKSYPQGTVLKYRTLTSKWYEATVYIKGKATTGYIKISDVENIQTNIVNLNGIAKQNPTKIYAKASTSSNVLKDYPQGTVLKYESFTSGWYKAKVYINGRATAGYINANDVETAQVAQTDLRGVALNSPTNIYEEASTSLGVIKNYPQGTVLKYKSFSNNWYEAKVYINGKPKTGYIHASHVETSTSTPKVEEALAKVKVNVYSKASRNSSVLKAYDKNTLLKLTTFTSKWYEAKVYANGDWHIGYVATDDVTTTLINHTNYDYTLSFMVEKQSSVGPLTDRWQDYAYIREDGLEVDNADNPTTGAVINYNWNVREGAGTNFWALGKVNMGSTVKILGKELESAGQYYWYKIEYKKQWVNAKPEQVAKYVDPTKFEVGTPEYLQFLLLSKSAGLNVTEVNERILKGKGILEGKGSSFIQAAQTYNINEIYLISHAFLETGHGTSQLATGVLVTEVDGEPVEPKTVYNMYGIGAIDSCPEGSGCPLKYGSERAYKEGWFTPEAAIVGGAQFISEDYIHAGQDTLYKMRWNPASPATHQYAADIAWAKKQVYSIYNLYSLLDNYKMIFDVPQFKEQ